VTRRWCVVVSSGVARAIGVVAVICAPAEALAVQTSASPTFEVASVKPAARETLLQRGFSCGFGAGGRFMALGTLEWLIACAYGVPAARAGQEIAGGPKWLSEALFAIVATSPPDRIPRSQSEGLAMLRTLLDDRFKLVVHRETRSVPMWALVVARRDGKLGPQLHPTAPDCAAWIANGRRGAPPSDATDLPCGRGIVNASAIRNSAMPLSQFASLLSPRVERPVQDRTGLEGNFYVDLQWKADLGPLGPPDGGLPDRLPTSIFTALQEQLGLKLESTRGSADLLVVDHAELPTANQDAPYVDEAQTSGPDATSPLRRERLY
jgi:bla regulator protein blaR1